MTSEGGGAVAFPVMTLVMGIKVGHVRDFPVVTLIMGIRVGEVRAFPVTVL